MFAIQLLDVSDLTINEINIVSEGGKIPVNYAVSDLVKDIGAKLTIDLPTKTSGELKVSIVYETSPKASGLQWLTPENTLGKKHPYMYSQCQVNDFAFICVKLNCRKRIVVFGKLGYSCTIDCSMSRYRCG